MKVRFAEVSNANLQNVHITDGQLVVVKDTGDIYYDDITVRQKLSDVIPVTTLPNTGLVGKIYLNINTNGLYIWNNDTQAFQPVTAESIASGDIYQYPLIFDANHKQSALPYGRILGMPVVLEMSGANNPSVTLTSANSINMALFGIPDSDGWITTTANYDVMVAVNYIVGGVIFVEIPALINPLTINGKTAVAGINMIQMSGPGPINSIEIACASGVTKFRCWSSVIPNPSTGVSIDVATNSLKAYTPYFAPYTITIPRNVSGAYDSVQVKESLATTIIRTNSVARTSADAQIAVDYINDGTNYTSTVTLWWPPQFSDHTMTSSPIQNIPSSITVPGSVDSSVTLTTKQTHLEPILAGGGTQFALGVIYQYTSTKNQTITATISDVLNQTGVGSFTLQELLPESSWLTYTDTVNDITEFGRVEAGLITVNTNNTTASLFFASDWKLAGSYYAAPGDTSPEIAINDYDCQGNPLVGISALKLVCIPNVRTAVREGGKKDLIMIEQVALESLHSIHTTKYDWMGDLTSPWIMTAAELDALDPIWAQGATILFYAK
jgi:hypothetical protein